ncbi:PDZ domain-containing protein [Corynebacterium uberis]|uniref:YlbL family protein n=1 Tax=Corynebacterium sp. c6VSa_13 TaxID=2913496 RepID=UPI001D0AF5E5|nr:PDZ domain-containing protein [Corynebacterium uberis]MCZ9309201.1 PDZ domain-containing protein [Corynebacterium sp. c6VSa_13]UDL76363.1 PDZ domain-containing protein [Corynebacterium uberis]UDL78575.1 PDZ domain-containing protein [Corynebacterium uberis]UDL80856.1 PDZ domain-containing protein [Corynebacterium uberis]UDL85199.1 PDZ domain-containing protein [Corynebacterium uberis]
MSHQSRRLTTLTWGALPLLALTVLVSLDHVPGTSIDLTVPYAAQGPGPTIDTLGAVDGKQVVEITGAQAQPTDGHLNMTTVSVRSHMTLAQALGRWLLTDDTLVPIEQVFPPDKSPEEVTQANTIAFSNSEASATVAALNHLHRALQVEVADVLGQSAAEGTLKAGDVIRAVDATPVDRPGQVRDAVARHQPGEQLALTIERDGARRDVTVTLGSDPEDQTAPLLGILMSSASADGIAVDYNLSDIGGPSAGLIFSLAVVDKLSPGSVTGGKFVAGTGTIAEDGTVGPIGGIEHKVTAAQEAGAEVFLSPAANCQAALGGKHDSMTVIKVDTLDSALRSLHDYAEGKQVPTC